MNDNITKKCPECGCDKYVTDYGLGNPNHRCCIECGQEWFVDVEYREDTELRATIARLESELRKADEAIVENCRLCLKYGKGQYIVMDKSMCDNCPTMKQLKTARARLEQARKEGE